MLILALIAAAVLTPTAVVVTGWPRWAARPMRRALSRGGERAMIATGHGLKTTGAAAGRATRVGAAGAGKGARAATRAGRAGTSHVLWVIADHLSGKAAGPVPATLTPEKATQWAARLTGRAAWWRKAGDVVSHATRVTCSCGHVSVDTPWRNTSAAHLKTCPHRRSDTASKIAAARRTGTGGGSPPAGKSGPRSAATTNPGHHTGHHTTTGGGSVTHLARLIQTTNDVRNMEPSNNADEFTAQVRALAEVHLALSHSVLGWVEAMAARKDPATGRPAPIDPRVTHPLNNAAGQLADAAKIVLLTIDEMHKHYAKQFEAAAQPAPEKKWFQ